MYAMRYGSDVVYSGLLHKGSPTQALVGYYGWSGDVRQRDESGWRMLSLEEE